MIYPHGIPEELNSNNWIITEIKPDPLNDDHLLKIPYKGCKWSQTENLRKYETVINEIYSLPNHNCLHPAFILNSNNLIWCIDLDNHDNDPEQSALNNEIMEKAKEYDLYITLSISERGFHIFGTFDSIEQKALFKNYNKKDSKFEFYVNGRYLCENETTDPINEPEKIKSGTAFLYDYLLKKCPDADIFVNQTSTEEETKEDTPTMTEQPTEQTTSETTKEDKEPEQTPSQSKNNDTTYFVVKAEDMTPEQIVKVIRNHKDATTRSNIENIFNGSLTNASEDLQTLYNVVYYWTPDFEKFKGVLMQFTPLYNWYEDKCRKEHKGLWKEIDRKLKKTGLSSDGHNSYLKFDKVTGDFVGFGKSENTGIVAKETTPITKNNDLQTGKSIEYVKILLQNDPLLKDLVYNNVFTYELIKTKNILWNKNFEVLQTNINEKWNNTDDAGLRLYLEKKYRLTKCREIIDDAFKVVYEFGNKRHPIKTFFETLPQWDGVERVPSLLIDYMGAEDTEYCRQVIIKMLSACYQRIYNPGCKFDYMCVLVGKQGIGKSSFVKGLAGKYFGAISSSIDFDKGIEKITGKWIVEFDELATFKKSGVETIKSFITNTKDTYRVPYEKRPEDRQRQAVFFGTTNNTHFLMDSTGNRRFWIIECGKQTPTKQWQNMKEEIHQIWAEVKEKYSDCELYLSPELEEEARKRQSSHISEYVYRPQIEKYLKMFVPKNKWFYDMTPAERKRYYEEFDYSSDYDRIKAEGKLDDYQPNNIITPLMIWNEVIPHHENQPLNAKTKKEIFDCLLSFDDFEYCERCRVGKPLKFYQRPNSYFKRKTEKS